MRAGTHPARGERARSVRAEMRPAPGKRARRPRAGPARHKVSGSARCGRGRTRHGVSAPAGYGRRCARRRPAHPPDTDEHATGVGQRTRPTRTATRPARDERARPRHGMSGGTRRGWGSSDAIGGREPWPGWTRGLGLSPWRPWTPGRRSRGATAAWEARSGVPGADTVLWALRRVQRLLSPAPVRAHAGPEGERPPWDPGTGGRCGAAAAWGAPDVGGGPTVTTGCRVRPRPSCPPRRRCAARPSPGTGAGR